MADQDRINTLTANCWASEYREHGKVDFEEAALPLLEADDFYAVVPIMLEAFQQPERSQELANTLMATMMGIVRGVYSDEVQSILEAEAEEQAVWKAYKITAAKFDEIERRMNETEVL